MRNVGFLLIHHALSSIMTHIHYIHKTKQVDTSKGTSEHQPKTPLDAVHETTTRVRSKPNATSQARSLVKQTHHHAPIPVRAHHAPRRRRCFRRKHFGASHFPDGRDDCDAAQRGCHHRDFRVMTAATKHPGRMNQTTQTSRPTGPRRKFSHLEEGEEGSDSDGW